MNEKSTYNRDALIEKALTNLIESVVSSHDLEMRILQTVKEKEVKRVSVFSFPIWRGIVPAVALFVLAFAFCWDLWPVRLSIEHYVGEGPLLVNEASQSVPKDLAYGSRVSTMKNQLRLKLDKKTQVLLDRDTEVVVSSPKEVKLESGRLAYRHADNGDREFRLTTPAGMIKPIGTWFDADLSGNRLRIQVFEGKVQFLTGQSVDSVQSRQQLIFEQGRVEIFPQEGPVDSWWQNVISVPWTTLLEGRDK